MSITGIRELLSRSDASGSKSTILKPLTWFLALIIGGILTLLKFGSPIWLTIMLAVIFCLGVAVFFFVYIYCLINDRDSLRSEKFTIYNPQNEMFRLLGTKRSFSQNETFFFSHPYPPTLPFSA